MGHSRRYAGIGAVVGAAIGTVMTVGVWRTLAATGALPAYLLESVAFVAALPFGVAIVYPVAAVPASVLAAWPRGRSSPRRSTGRSWGSRSEPCGTSS